MPVEELAGTRISWRDAGSGAPVLLLHCTNGHGGAWRDLRVHLPGRHIVPDLPAHGRSGPLQPGRDFLRQSAEAMAALLERSGGAADIVGHSFGAVVALRLALDRPDLVRRLALYEPVLFAAARGSPEHDAYAARHEAILSHRDAAMRAKAFHAEWGDMPWDRLPEERRTYILERADLILRQRASIAEDATGLLDPGGLEGLRRAVLLVCGSDSPPVVRVVAERLAARLPEARFAVLEGAGHMGPVTDADALARIVVPFLSD